MPPTIQDSITLQCPRTDGSGFSFQVYTLAQFDEFRGPVNANLSIAVQSQPTLVSAQIGTYVPGTQTFTVDPAGKDVKVQTIAPKPANTSIAAVKIRDGRQNPDGSPVEFVVNITLVTPPAVPPTIELVTKHPLITAP